MGERGAVKAETDAPSRAQRWVTINTRKNMLRVFFILLLVLPLFEVTFPILF